MSDSTTMTIEFLRARLLSERTVSKAAKEKADQLAKRVMELEEQLRIMNIQRRKAEQAAMEAVSILETNGINDLSDAIDSSSDKDESPIAERGCEEDFGESEVCTKANEERIVVGDTQSNSYLEDSSSQVGSLSWKSHSSSPDSSRKTKGKQDRPRQRRNSFTSYVESSPKYNLGKSCRRIKRKEVGSSAEMRDDYAINSDDLANLSVKVSGSLTSLASLEKKEADGIGNERDEEMERVLEQQAQLIGQFEAEEKAQQEWEKKYNENKSSNLDLSKSEILCRVTEINVEPQKDAFACFEKIAYENYQAKSDGIVILPGSQELECPSKNPVLDISNCVQPPNTSDGEHPAGNASNDEHSGNIDNRLKGKGYELNAFLPTELSGTQSRSNFMASADGSVVQIGQHVEVSDIEACFVEIAFPTQVSTMSGSFHKKSDILVHETSDSGSSNNNDILAQSHIDSLPIGSNSATNSWKEIQKWPLSSTQEPSYTKPYQSTSNNLGGVLEALHQAKMSLKQDLHKLPLPGQGIKATFPSASTSHTRTNILGESLKGPSSSSSLFRLPTDIFPQAQSSGSDFYSSGVSLAASYPRPGCAITAGDDDHTAIPYFEAGPKNSMTKFDIGNYHPVIGIPASTRSTLPYSYLKADQIPFSNGTGVPSGGQNFNSYPRARELPLFSRHSLPSNPIRDGTTFHSRSASSVHRQYFEHFGIEEPSQSRYSLPYSDLTRGGTTLRDRVSRPQTDARNQMRPQDQYSLYGGNGAQSSMRTL
ncbi:uncharacterized protein LOC121970811 isoform X1 [Zingiber officinale]|uniref:Uncharacterized protein n=1 Tax=Zingiber officinale TaxID=94328 RepID=A0A8J5LEA1_ZINOF|nr:uncharacterized protein LOC121970811 isoform X1 [Zingiber officinale]XP_042377713.1 uncharacterized protein LOC121970811 isoform X1 [Zingiber officinale]KAG6515236.1 hypothetical protein ZIOFF_025621 [Zingiber officinale]